MEPEGPAGPAGPGVARSERRGRTEEPRASEERLGEEQLGEELEGSEVAGPRGGAAAGPKGGAPGGAAEEGRRGELRELQPPRPSQLPVGLGRRDSSQEPNYELVELVVDEDAKPSREQEEKRWVRGLEVVVGGGEVERRHPQDRKATWLGSPRFGESDDDAGEGTAPRSEYGTVVGSQVTVRRPTVRFSVGPWSSRSPSVRNVGCCLSDISAINELAIMGDPNLLEMVEEEDEELEQQADLALLRAGAKQRGGQRPHKCYLFLVSLSTIWTLVTAGVL